MNSSDVFKIKRLPIGIENFSELARGNFYYVDKTEMIRDFLTAHTKVNLFTRPRRFGKTLNMSMIGEFLDIQKNSSYFDDLNIGHYPSIVQMYRNQCPVIFITLKNVDGINFDDAKSSFKTTIGNLVSKYDFLFDSEKLNDNDKSRLLQIYKTDDTNQEVYSITDAALKNSLFTLSYLLAKHYDRSVVLIIDEYDVPLEKANEHGYYDAMIQLIRDMMNVSLKTNDYLDFAILSGCLQISQESLFTGLNNIMRFSITSSQFDDYFGFTESEVRDMLSYYNLSDKYDAFKEWYNGYRFGKTSVFCPWDVICYCNDLLFDRNCKPKDYWLNTSNNYAIRRFVAQQKSANAKEELELLISGYPVVREIHENLTYPDLFSSDDNFWSLLYLTGYLTTTGSINQSTCELVIPNAEIRDIFVQNIISLYADDLTIQSSIVDGLYMAFVQQDAVTASKLLTDLLVKTISIRDTAYSNVLKENYFHGLIAGVLATHKQWYVQSNVESGNGYVDLMLTSTTHNTGIVIEIKYAHDGNMDHALDLACKQISSRCYDQLFQVRGIETIIRVGIAFYRKKAEVQFV